MNKKDLVLTAVEFLKTCPDDIDSEVSKINHLISELSKRKTKIKKSKIIVDHAFGRNPDERYKKDLAKIVSKFPEVTSLRKLEILYYIINLKTNKEIADKLFISEKTVKFHKTDILNCTGFKTSNELARYYLELDEINNKKAEALPNGIKFRKK